MCEAHPPVTWGWAWSDIIMDHTSHESVCVYAQLARNNSLWYNLATAGDLARGQLHLVAKVCTCASLMLFLDEGQKATNVLHASGPKHVLIILYDCVLWCTSSVLTDTQVFYLSYEESHSSSTII